MAAIVRIVTGLGFLAGALCWGAGGAWAGPPGPLPQRLELDAQASHVDFVLGATLHTVEGSLRLERGEIEFDEESGAAAGRVVVDARSAETGSGMRDRNMHRDVLESERYSQIVFLPDRLTIGRRGPDEAEVELSGTVEIHGVREPLTIPATVRREGERVRVQGSFTVPYVEWGMRDYSNFVLRVSPTVDVHLDLVARLREAPEQPL